MWQVWVDTGGTFTDCIAVDPSSGVHHAKVLSRGGARGAVVHWVDQRRVVVRLAGEMQARCAPGWTFRSLDGRATPPATADLRQASDGVRVVAAHEREAGAIELVLESAWDGQRREGLAIELTTGEPAPVVAARLATGTAGDETLPAMAMRLATTRGTNALLERQVARTALLVTAGFGDLLVIGDQSRPDLFALNIEKPAPLYERVVEVHERIAADGRVLQPIDAQALHAVATEFKEAGIEAVAVALLNGYVNDEHERDVERVLNQAGLAVVSRSADIAALIGYLPRAETAVVDAALRPVIGAYVADVLAGVGGDARLHVMTSAGGLARADEYRACDSLLSGPAGGVAGAAAAATMSGHERIIGFDMGGTSTDVSRYDGDFEYQFEQRVGDARLLTAALAIETVAAGGGSICRCAEDRLVVGPESAGADPGPACYGRGGPLTLTDVNVLCGRIDTARFSIPIDVDAAQRAFDDVFDAARRVSGETVDRDALLDGFLEIANQRMASAIERISLRKGYDPGAYALVAFGGAGGQHACAVAQRLGMKTVLAPADASLLSAVGLGHAVIERFAQRQVLQRLDECSEQWRRWLKELAEQAIEAVQDEGLSGEAIIVRRRIVNLRLVGQDATLAVEVEDDTDVRAAFAQQYERMYGYALPREDLELESMRVVASGKKDEGARGSDRPEREDFGQERDNGAQTVRMRAGGRWCAVDVVQRAALRGGDVVRGPALITEPRSAVVVEQGWAARRDDAGAVVVEFEGHSSVRETPQAALAQAELFAHRLTSMAADMGQILQRTALSTNVKQRLDFSCAVLNAAGELVVNAPHIPVHLGAMGVCVRAVRKAIEFEPGDVVVTNHPAFGGSHLPDVTVISGVFDDDDELVGYVANRAHHAELGGTRPGSMPPNASRLIEEGVVLEPQYLARHGKPQFDALAQVLRSAAHPSRCVAENVADLRGQAAANRHGVEALRALARRSGRQELQRQMDLLAERAARVIADVIAGLPAECAARERLDDGSAIAVRLARQGERLVIDFEGTAGQHAGNLNAPPAVTHSAVLYVLRLLAGEAMPLNEGMLRHVEVRLPNRCLLNPDFGVAAEEMPAVVGGNVETSQRVVDTLLKALGVAACSQGTMNNVLFGNERFGYYETVCGGAGATADGDGASAVHTHMTNTRMTDAEVMEQRYPVRVRRFEVRRGSGGDGAHRGGDGVAREVEFLEDVSLSVLAQHRVASPYGMDGGGDGARGAQRVVRADGAVEELKGIDGVELRAGDRFVVETPGGGGWKAGKPESQKAGQPESQKVKTKLKADK